MSKSNRISPSSANVVVEEQLHDSLRRIEGLIQADCLGLSGSLYNGLEDFVMDVVEERDAKRERLAVILETDGGLIEVTERIANVFRKHYPNWVEFIIPNFAMSAGTVLVMSGDAIHMDYYSVLGPIDPQVVNREGKWVPALGYLEKFRELMDKAATKKGLNDAEMAYLASHFDPADLYSYEQAKELSTQLLKQWLVKYKFKEWKETETRKKKVTQRMKTRRAQEIADRLNRIDRWNSHARPIPMAILREELNLKIDDFGSNPDLRDAIKCYYRLLRDYMTKMQHKWAIHMIDSYVHIGGAHA